MLIADIAKLSKKLILSFVTLGAIQYGVSYLAWVRAYLHVDISHLILFISIIPIYVSLIGMVYEGKLSHIKLLTSVASFLSILLIYSDQLRFEANLFKGFIFAQIANFCFAYGQVTYKKIQQNLPEVKDSDVFALMLLGALIVIMIATTASNGWNFLAQVSYREFGVIFYLGTVLSGLCMFLWNKGACMVSNGTLAVINNLKFALNALVSVLLFQERIDLVKVIVSLTIILICVFIQERYQKRYIIIDKRSSVEA